MAPFQIQYYFEDGSHTMDAFIQNKCETEFLGILKQLSAIFEVAVTVETEPNQEQGFVRTFNIHPKKEEKYSGAKIKVVTEFIASVLTTATKIPANLTDTILESNDIVITDKEGKKLENEQLKVEIDFLKNELKSKTEEVNKNISIRKRKSNFYHHLSDNKKIKTVSFQASEEKNIAKDQFKQFILESDKLPPVEMDEAIIELISPVLKKGNFKWLGFYEGKRISFNMKSNEFKELVQSGSIKFVNGTNINCMLVIQKKVNSEGEEKIVSYNVERVNSYYENDQPIETKVETKEPKVKVAKEAKKQKIKQEVEKVQLQLF